MPDKRRANEPPDDRRSGFDHGWFTAASGGQLSDNPFTPESAKHITFEHGWNGFHDQEKKKEKKKGKKE